MHRSPCQVFGGILNKNGYSLSSAESFIAFTHNPLSLKIHPLPITISDNINMMNYSQLKYGWMVGHIKTY